MRAGRSMHAFNVIVQPDAVEHAQHVRVQRRTSPATPASPACRPIRSTGACRRSRSARSRACATSRRRGAPIDRCQAGLHAGRGRPARTPTGSAARSSSSQRHAGPTRTRAAASRSRGLYTADGATDGPRQRPGLRGLPARPAAAGDAPVQRSRSTTSRQPIVDPRPAVQRCTCRTTGAGRRAGRSTTACSTTSSRRSPKRTGTW